MILLFTIILVVAFSLWTNHAHVVAVHSAIIKTLKKIHDRRSNESFCN